MSAVLEQTVEDVAYLKGATILGLKVERDPDFGDEFLALDVRTKDDVSDGVTSGRFVRIQVWQDPEGNGPGFLSLTGLAATRKELNR